MSRQHTIDFEFVEYIPEHLEEGIFYIAPQFGAVMHLCCDGCGARVSTPLHPGQWTLTFDGETISLNPSVGNWELPCKSHYIIRRSRVLWAGEWSSERIAQGAMDDRLAVRSGTEAFEHSSANWWSRFRDWFRRLIA
jgi:hypothetical protein